MGLLRFLLAFSVLIVHTLGYSAPVQLLDFNYIHSTTAVEIFFVISGFYMQMVLSEKYTASHLGENYIIKFYLSRYSRLFPIYFLCVILTATFLLLTIDSFDHAEYRSSPLIALEIIANLPNSIETVLLQIYILFTNMFMFFQDAVLNLGVEGDQVFATIIKPDESDVYVPSSLLVPPAWSLGVELSFYIIAPFLLKIKNSYLISCFLILMALKVFFIMSGPLSDLYYRSFHFVLGYFLLGAISYRYKDKLKFFKTDKFNTIRLLYAYAFVITITLFSPYQGLNYSPLIVCSFGVFLPSLFYATKNIKIDRWIGELSYPVYIFHMLIYMVVANNWIKFDQVAVALNVNHVQIIQLVTIVFTLLISIFLVLIEAKYINPVRRRLFEK